MSIRSKMSARCLPAWRAPDLYVFLASIAPITGLQAQSGNDSFESLNPSSTSRIAFQKNLGQWPEHIRFVAQAGDIRARVEKSSLALELNEAAVSSMRSGVLVRLSIDGQMSMDSVGERELGGMHHYCLEGGRRWVRNAPLFEAVRMPCVIDGVDWVLREQDGSLEYDLEIAPGTELSQLVIRCQGQTGLSVEEDGSLWLHTTAGILRQPPPVSWEVSADGVRRKIDVHFKQLGDDCFGFVAPGRVSEYELHIDPGIQWASYVGGSGSREHVTALRRDSVDNLFVVGTSGSPTFPVTPGAYATPSTFGNGFFISKFDAAYNLIYSSFLDVNWAVEMRTLALDSLGQATVGGYVFNTTGLALDFPTTANAFDRVANTQWPAFVLRLSAQGDALVFSTFLENPPGGCLLYALDVAPSGATIVGGAAGGPTYPTTTGAYSTTFNSSGYYDGFVTRLSPDGSHLEWSTLLGGSNHDEVRVLALDSAENVTVVGKSNSADFPRTPGTIPTTTSWPTTRFFVTRLNAQGSSLVWSAVVMSSSDFEPITPNAMAMDRDGSVVVVGETISYFLPTTPGALFHAPNPPINDYNGYFFKLGPAGATLDYASYLSPRTMPYGVSLDPSGVATIVGGDRRSTMPITPGAPAGSGVVNGADVMLCRIDPTGTELIYSARLGGPNWEFGECLEKLDNHRVVIGGNSAPGFPVTPGAFDTTYGGGQEDGVLAVVDLLFQGVQVLGPSSPSCQGSIGMNTVGSPSSASSTFGFWCSGAPPNSSGWLLLGAVASTPDVVGGATLQLDRFKRLIVRPITTDARGYVRTAWPLPALQPGSSFAAQYVFRNTPACTGSTVFSSSNALLLQVQ